MKKILSLCLTIVMMVSLLACFTVNAVSTDGTYQYYYFHLGDFLKSGFEPKGILQLPGYNRTNRLQMVNAENYLDSATVNASNYKNNSGGYYYGAVYASAAGNSQTVEVYVPASGTYNIWVHAPYNGAPIYSVPASAAAFYKFSQGWKISVNGGADYSINNENYDINSPENKIAVAPGEVTETNTGYRYNNQFYWDSITVQLQEGKNEIKLTAVNANAYISAMLITNNIALQSNRFAYIGNIDMHTMLGNSNLNYTWQSIKYFGDGQYHENWAADGFINLADYSDNVAPTVEIADSANCADDSIQFSWAAGDAGYSVTGKYLPSFNGTAFAGSQQGSQSATTKFSDASGIYKIEVFENDVLLDTLAGDATSYTFTAPYTGSSYNFKVVVTDCYGYTDSDTAVFATTGPSDTEGPNWPAGAELTAANASFSSTITWPEAIDDRELLGYDIYEGSVDPSNLVESVTSATTSYTVTLQPGESKDIYVVANDRAGNSSSALSTTVTSCSGSKNYLIRTENFDVPDESLKIYHLYNISDDMIAAGCMIFNQGPSSLYMRGKVAVSRTTGAEMSAKVYIDEAGEYAALMMVEQNGSGVQLSIEGQKTTSTLGSVPKQDSAGTSLYGWVKADRTWQLEEGWNTITVNSPYDYGRFAAIFLTNGVDIQASEVTYLYDNAEVVVGGKLNTALYEDTEGPTYAAGNITVAYDSTVNAATITWPAATDRAVASLNRASSSSYEMAASGLTAYKIYVNDKEIGETDDSTTTFTINSTVLGRELVAGEILDIKVEALDVYGNASTKTMSYEVSKFVISDFHVENSLGEASSIPLLNDGTIKAKLVIKNISEAASDIRLAIAVYDAEGDLLYGTNVEHTVDADRANDTVTAEITGARNDLTGCTVKAHLWNADDLSPIKSTITIQ